MSIANKLHQLADSPGPHLFNELREAADQVAQLEAALDGYQSPIETVCGICEGPIELEREESCERCFLTNQVHELAFEINELHDLVCLGDDIIAAACIGSGLITQMVEEDEDTEAGETEPKVLEV